MAFTRANIRNLAKDCGIELPKEFEDALISEHTTARDKYAEDQVTAALANKSDTANVKDSDEYRTLKQQFDDYKSEVEGREARAAKESAYRDILRDANLSERGIEKAIKYAKWDDIELENDGKIKNATEHLNAAKTEWAEYVTSTSVLGHNTATPPATQNQGGVMTKADIMKISDTSERQAALAKFIQSQKGI